MKFTITKEELILGVQTVQNIAATRTTLPILSNVLLRAAAGKLHLTATDLDTSITCAVEATVAKEGSTTVSAKRLFGVVREFRSMPIEVEASDKNVLSLRCGPSSYKINGLPAAEFPPTQSASATDGICCTQAALKTLFSRTSFAMADDTSKATMCGTLLTVNDKGIVAVASDGKRLAWADMMESTGASAVKSAIVPPNAVREVQRLLGDTGDVEVALTASHIEFSLGGEAGFSVSVKSKLMEGQFPNWQQVVPKGLKHRIALLREEFASALSRAKLMTTDNFNSVKLVFSKNNLRISVNAAETGEALEDIALKYEGEEIAIAFNPDFLIQPLNIVSGEEEVFIELLDGLTPGLLKINGPFMYIIMPMRFN